MPSTKMLVLLAGSRQWHYALGPLFWPLFHPFWLRVSLESHLETLSPLCLPEENIGT